MKVKERKNYYWKSQIKFGNLDFFLFRSYIFCWKKDLRLHHTYSFCPILFVLLFNIDSRSGSRDPYPTQKRAWSSEKVQEERDHPLAHTALFYGNSKAKNLTKFKKCEVREENHAEQRLRD